MDAEEFMVVFVLIIVIGGGLFWVMIMLPDYFRQDIEEKEFFKTATCEELNIFILDELRNDTKINGERAVMIFEKECSEWALHNLDNVGGK